MGRGKTLPDLKGIIMFCENCKQEWSDRVYLHHVGRCSVVDEAPADVPAEKSIDEMKVAELREFAEANEIEIPEDITLKADIQEFLKMAVEEVPAVTE
jgi:hypothetical protein